MLEKTKDKFTIRELSEEFNVTPRALRFYEQKNLLSPTRQGLTRFYSRKDRARLRLILRGKRLGFPLNQILEMLDLYYVDTSQVKQFEVTLMRSKNRLKVLHGQKKDITEAIEELSSNIKQIEKILENKKK